MAFFRDCCYAAALAISSPIWAISLLRTGKWKTDWAGRFGNVDQPQRSETAKTAKQKKTPTILIHGVSVGEINAIRQMVEMLSESGSGTTGTGNSDSSPTGNLLPVQSPSDKESPPNIVIASTTNTGIARAESLFKPRHKVVRFPFDFSRSVKRFLDAIRPDVMVLVELELWPNLVDECNRRGIPIIVVNGRLSERSFNRYFKFKSFIRSTFAKVTQACVQTDEYAKRFRVMGVPEDSVVVTDSMKWDNAKITQPASVEGVDQLATAMGLDRSRPIVVVGSTGSKATGNASEESLICKTLMQACDDATQIVIVPRKPERFDQVAEAMNQFTAKHKVVRRTGHRDGATRPLDGTRLFLLDTMGELGKAYALADVAIVGRSFVDLYGSDPLEPIAMGKPTIIGSRYSDFDDMINTLEKEDGISVVDSFVPSNSDRLETLAEAVNCYLGNEHAASKIACKGQSVIRSRQGATRKHVEVILSHLPASTHAHQ
jgi:3-deoxy-D-manno-octulosonic-acid transferase